MPLKTDPAWEERVLSLKENNKSWGAGRIATALGQEAAQKGFETPPPSEATVRRILHRRWDNMSEEEQKQYRYLYWPESMERGDLPWEASASALEILGLRIFARPTIRQTRWFWRISMAAPDLAGEERLDLARWFASWEAVGERMEESVRGIEGHLRFAPWRSDEHEQRYDAALAEGRIPLLPKRGSGIFREGERWEPLPD